MFINSGKWSTLKFNNKKVKIRSLEISDFLFTNNMDSTKNNSFQDF